VTVPQDGNTAEFDHFKSGEAQYADQFRYTGIFCVCGDFDTDCTCIMANRSGLSASAALRPRIGVVQFVRFLVISVRSAAHAAHAGSPRGHGRYPEEPRESAQLRAANAWRLLAECEGSSIAVFTHAKLIKHGYFIHLLGPLQGEIDRDAR